MVKRWAIVLWILPLLWLAIQPARAQYSKPSLEILSTPLDAAALSNDGHWLASGGRDNLVHLWNPATGEVRGLLSGHTGWITRLAISPDTTVLASASHDTHVILWDLRTFEIRATLQHHTGSVTGVAFSPDGHLVVTAGLDGLIWLGEASTGAEIGRLTNFSGPAWSVAFSADSRRLAVGSEDGTIWLWALYDNSIARLDSHHGAVTSLQFSVDGNQLVSSSWDGTARVWNVAASPPNFGTTVAIFSSQEGPVTAAGFTQSGVVTVSLDGVTRLWDTARGSPVADFQGAAVTISSAAFSTDGRWVVTAGTDGTLDLWDVSHQTANIPASEPSPQTTLVAMLPQPTADVMQLLPVFTPPALPTRAPRPAATPQPEQPNTTVVQQEPSQSPVAQQPQGTVLSLPTVNVYVGIKNFPIEGNTWAIDPWERMVGHLEGTAWFSGAGNVVLGGHSSMPNGRPGIFAGLYQLNTGDPILVTVDGAERRYVVTSKFSVHYDDLSVVYPSGDSRLTLITCDLPSFDPNTQLYSERLVVVAVPG